MILTADIGNTNIKLGVFDSGKLLFTGRIMTHQEGYGSDLLSFFAENDLRRERVCGICVSSVVYHASERFKDAAKQLLIAEPFVVDNTADTGIKIKTDNPSQLGADRLVNAAAAFHYYRGRAIIIDFGTATTYDVLSEEGEFLGGVIAPGMGLCAQALFDKTDALPRVDVERPKSVMGTSTCKSIKSGIYHGNLAQLEYFVKQLKKENGADFKVIATGGYSGLFKGATCAVDIFDPDLTLKGLYCIYKMNRQ